MPRKNRIWSGALEEARAGGAGSSSFRVGGYAVEAEWGRRRVSVSVLDEKNSSNAVWLVLSPAAARTFGRALMDAADDVAQGVAAPPPTQEGE